MGFLNKVECQKCGQRNDPKEKICFYCEKEIEPKKKKENRQLEPSRSDKQLPVIIILLITAIFPLPKTTTSAISIPYTTQNIQSASIELGDTQMNQQGTEGRGQVKTKLIAPVFAYLIGRPDYFKYSLEKVTETTREPVSKIVANGTKKYQYMWCSNGAYRYYTNDQFKNPLTGFTHKSPDACAQNKQGHMTQLSDSAPQSPRTIYKQLPSYTPRTTTTRCYDDVFGGITCNSY